MADSQHLLYLLSCIPIQMLLTLQYNCWLVYNTADVHVCNNLIIIIDYYEWWTNIERSTSDIMFSDRRKVCLQLSQKVESKGIIFNLFDVYFLSHSFCNLVSLEKLNNISTVTIKTKYCIMSQQKRFLHILNNKTITTCSYL